MRPAAVLLALALATIPAQALTVVIYSRADATETERAVRLLRAAGPVWRDLDLQPGTRWRPNIARRICRADRVLVVWSAFAAESAEVARELQTAARCRRILVPLLLDSSAMPAALGEWQAVDWR